MGYAKGDRVWFTGQSILVNEGTVEDVSGRFIKISYRCGSVWRRDDEVAGTRDALMASSAYRRTYVSRYMQAQRRSSFGRIAAMPI